MFTRPITTSINFFFVLGLLGFAIPQRLFAQTNSRVTVKNSDEFVRSIASDRVVDFAAGEFVITGTSLPKGAPVRWEDVHDGAELVIDSVTGLTLRAASPGSAILLARPSYAHVLAFENCADIRVDNLVLGHGPKEGYCAGGVIRFENCQRIQINSTELFGSGTYGLTIKDVDGLAFAESAIRDCTYGILDAEAVKDIRFRHSRFIRNREYDLVFVRESSEVAFRHCQFIENMAGLDGTPSGNSLFAADQSSLISVRNCTFCQQPGRSRHLA